MVHTFYMRHCIMKIREPDIRLKSVGVCIYCLRAPPEVRLTAEHIIPKGLGGNLVLVDASCLECAVVTGRFEQKLLRDTFRNIRGALGISSGRRKKDRQTHAKVKRGVKPDQTEVELPFSEGMPFCGTFLTTPGPPNIFHGQNAPDSPYKMTFIFSPLFKSRMETYLTKHSGKGTYEFLATFWDGNFCQMLAKIAHSFAVAHLGVDGFKPYLTEYIRAKDPPRDFTYIGGQALDVDNPALHDITLVVAPKRYRTALGIAEKEFVLVELCLLANCRAPNYLIVVGEPIP